MNKDKIPHSVSEYIAILNDRLSDLFGEVVGEISELKTSARGHVYFVIKDKETNEILPCTIWQRTYALNGLELEVGMEVLIKGTPEFYGPFGKLSFIAKSAELVGEGALKKAYEKLKKKLSAEGLFDKQRKRTLPVFPKTIGIITSVHGEVIHDFTSNLRKAGFKVKILDCRVEGPESGRSLTLSVRAFRNEQIDVLILMRGGGSIQSLAGFDNEALVREIVSFPVPVITGIGHHKDVTLAALAADVAESTPSFVAALLNKSWDDAEQVLARLQQNILELYKDTLASASRHLTGTFRQAREVLDGILERYEEDKRHITTGLGKIGRQVEKVKETTQRTGLAIIKNMSGVFEDVRSRYFITIPRLVSHRYDSSLRDVSKYIRQTPRWVMRTYASSLRGFANKTNGLARIVRGHDPERQLRLGYSIVSSGGNIVRSVKGLRKGQELALRVSDGSILSEIKDVK